MEKARLRLFVGLGNPVPAYGRTRHNVGSVTLDRFTSTKGLRFERSLSSSSEVAKDFLGRIFMKPLTYMNCSGYPVVTLLRFHKILPEEALIVLDDCTIPLGKLRIRKGGGSGGHNGLASILHCLSTEAIPRLRIGIGRATTGTRLAEYVLGTFSKKEKLAVDRAVARACDAIEMLGTSGIETAMNQFN
ncbi:MAG: aminoacyl-tRNA hydrolase [Candidatus Xiphinematobacter sp.]|nr:MAG: aminoacyl-tRNA hydrolase [Candidatus Xiphinematobacter sp.]QQY09162.1 MAG: aminoacyl-tRNA hydrolase [Candidatus Xiphinematobacter sp.]QQY11388.1 MAG: aminoacyl-tRNA hydrolase [Candidatus Xiphinematobacter sp.]